MDEPIAFTTEMTPMIFDARGNGNGLIACTITGGHNNRITDYTALVMIRRKASGSENSKE